MTDAISFDLVGKVAVVTGATRGIGREIARGLAAAGAKVYGVGRDIAAGRGLELLLGTRFIQADLSDADAGRRVAEALSEESAIDILVNNAAVEIPEGLHALDHDDFVRTMLVNVYSPTSLVWSLLPQLKRSAAASIVNVSSIHESVPYRHHIAYSSSKAALALVTATLSIELAAYGIRVNAVAPGAIETDINRETLDGFGRDRFAANIPLGRIGVPNDVVGPVVFLASPAAAYVSGATLHVDGAFRHSLVDYATPAPEQDG